MRVLNNVLQNTLAQVSARALHLICIVIHVVRLSVVRSLTLCSLPCSFPCVSPISSSSTWTFSWTSSSLWSSLGQYTTGTPPNEESGPLAENTLSQTPRARRWYRGALRQRTRRSTGGRRWLPPPFTSHRYQSNWLADWTQVFRAFLQCETEWLPDCSNSVHQNCRMPTGSGPTIRMSPSLSPSSGNREKFIRMRPQTSHERTQTRDRTTTRTFFAFAIGKECIAQHNKDTRNVQATDLVYKHEVPDTRKKQNSTLDEYWHNSRVPERKQTDSNAGRRVTQTFLMLDTNTGATETMATHALQPNLTFFSTVTYKQERQTH